MLPIMADMQEEIEREISYRITDDDIERSQLLVGVDAARGGREFYKVLSPDAIRNFARGYGDDNPLFVDDEYGPTTRWGSQIAPPMIGIALASPLYGDPVPEEIRKGTRGLFAGIHVFVSGQSTEWYRPLFPGDELFSFGGIESTEVKKSEFADRSVIRVARTVSMNQRAEIVQITRVLMIHTERKTARDKGKYADIKPATYSEEQIAELDEIYADEHARGAEPRFYEDVEVGEPLPKMAKGPLTLTEIVCFHAGGYGFAPYNISSSRIGYKNRQRIPKFYIKNAAGIPDVSQRVHWESDWAQAIGNPMAYDYAVMRECWLTHYLTDWIGDDGWIERQHDEVRKFNYIGDTQIITGEVVAKHEHGGRCSVDIEMRGTNQRGDVTCPGSATVALPSRDHGPVVLPEAAADLRQKSAELMERHGQLLRERRAGAT
jgi:acyl dehydratase